MSTTTLGPVGTETGILVPFPDPTRHPDEMNSFRQISRPGGAYLLDWHFGSPETTLIAAELYISLAPLSNVKGLRAPDLLIAFDVDPEACDRSNAYVISEQGKPPDFVLEVASRSTGRVDVRDKPADYAALGIPEYWRFDETGEYYGQRLAGDRLAGNRYEPVEIAELGDGSLEGYSEVLELYLRWEAGRLKWYDPETGRAIMDLAAMQRIAEAERQAGWRRSNAPKRSGKPGWKRSNVPKRNGKPGWKQSNVPKRSGKPSWKQSNVPKRNGKPSWKRSNGSESWRRSCVNTRPEANVGPPIVDGVLDPVLRLHILRAPASIPIHLSKGRGCPTASGVAAGGRLAADP